MCGEIETEESLAEELYAQFVDHVQAFLVNLRTSTTQRDSGQLYDYLDALFRRTLRNSVTPEKAPEDVTGYQRLCMEPLVFARVAGFMAAHQPLEGDPLRRLIEALMTGYAEGEAAMDSDTEHRHVHGHEHTH